MNKKNLSKYLTLLYSEGHITNGTWRDWNKYEVEMLPNIFKSVPFWDEWFIVALLKFNKENIVDGTLNEDNLIIPEKKLYGINYVVKESIYQGSNYHDTVEGYSEEHVANYFHSGDFEYSEGDFIDTDVFDSDITGVELEDVVLVKNNSINESSNKKLISSNIKKYIKEKNKLLSEELITESSVMDAPVRKVVRDLVNIIKNKDIGEYSLPEFKEDGDEDEYDFRNVPLFSVLFFYEKDYTIEDDYLINGAILDGDEFIIAIKLILNPKKYPQSLYDIIADLNDVVAHELEHIYQESSLRPDDEMDIYMDNEKRPIGKEYYLQSHEIPAQFKGFRRINKLRKESMKKTIRDWFIRHKNVHNLSNYDIEEISSHLAKLFKKKYGRK